MFQLIALSLRWFFDSLSDEAPLNWGPWAWVSLLIVLAISRNIFIFADQFVFSMWVAKVNTLMRKNIMDFVLSRPGADALPFSSGEAVNRCKEDIQVIGQFTAWAVFVIAQGLFAITALIIMMGINPNITLFVFGPLVGVVVIANLGLSRIHKYRSANRKATGEVSSFIGTMFGAVQAIKVAGVEQHILKHFEKLNDERRKSAVNDGLFNSMFKSFLENTVNLGTGGILLLAGSALHDGSFTIGDFVLFIFYLDEISRFTGVFGQFFARAKQAKVSLRRLDEFFDGTSAEILTQATSIQLGKPLPPYQGTVPSRSEPLQLLEANLTYHFPNSKQGIENIELRLKKGSFTVITGRIGSGKTTLLRTLLGLLPLEKGSIFWNGKKVDAPDSFFIPPRSAYTSQVPRLFSESLRNNILSGLDEHHANLNEAVAQAALHKDVESFENGLDTKVGPLGMKLSGGQKQRGATARMLIRKPDLLVFDDLSSALDVKTEKKLWEGLFEQDDQTYLVVSHRRVALSHADHILVLKDGRVEDQGNLEELLERCEEMRKIWG